MPDIKITCPYCFNVFEDQDVHFRMETVFKEEELDPTEQGRTRQEIEESVITDGVDEEVVQKELNQYDLRAKFQAVRDPDYEDFWKKYGSETTEVSFDAIDGISKSVRPYNRPVYAPCKKEHSDIFSRVADKKLIVEDGLVVGTTDCFNNVTKRRVCPRCHNPLPGSSYGRYPVLFIPVIGIPGSGKTVYLSQVCKYIKQALSLYGISCNKTSQYAAQYVNNFPVKIGTPLPIGTPPEMLMQPLCFDVAYRDNNDIKHSHTLVFYDIAGENCVKDERLQHWGPFILNANAFLLVIDPKQFQMDMGADNDPSIVLNAIYNSLGEGVLERVPFAVCVSKGDKAAKHILGSELSDVTELYDKQGNPLPKFNANDYNVIHDKMNAFIRRTDNELHTELHTHYKNYNYFLFSALGCDVKGDAGTTEPVAPPVPKRIMEPLLWILEEYKYITAEGIIHEPTDWYCPKCNMRIKNEVKFCPKCHVNADETKWHCIRDNIDNDYEKGGKNYCPKCKRDPDGNKKPFFPF